MIIEFIGEVCDILGKILIAITAIAVHDTVLKERQFDDEVQRTIRKEHVFGFLGILLLIIGFVLRQIGKVLV